MHATHPSRHRTATRPRATTRLRAVALLLGALAALAAPLLGTPAASATSSAGERTLVGTLSLVISETTEGHGDDEFALTTDAGTIWNLTGVPHTTPPGTRVSVTGTETGPFRLAVRQVDPLAAPAAMTAMTGTRRVLVLKVTVPGHRRLVTDGTARPISSTELRTTMADAAEFYSAASTGQLTFTSQVADQVFALGSDSDPDTCWDTPKFVPAANAAALAAGIDQAAFDHVFYVLPSTMRYACGYPNVLARAQLPGRLMWSYGATDQNTAAHELGHNLGSPHSKTLRCTDPTGATVVAISATCTVQDGPYSVCPYSAQCALGRVRHC